MSQIVSKRHSYPVLRVLIGTGLLCGCVVGGVAGVMTLPWLALRLAFWVTG